MMMMGMLAADKFSAVALDKCTSVLHYVDDLFLLLVLRRNCGVERLLNNKPWNRAEGPADQDQSL